MSLQVMCNTYGCFEAADANTRQLQEQFREQLETYEPEVRRQMLVGAAAVIGTGAARTVAMEGGVAAVQRLAIGSSTNGTLSALSGNSPRQVAAEAAQGAIFDAATSTGGTVGTILFTGAASRAAQAGGEVGAAHVASRPSARSVRSHSRRRGSRILQEPGRSGRDG